MRNGLAIAGATASTYDLPAASAADAGTYTVKVTGPVGSVTSPGAALSVLSPFVFTTQPLGAVASTAVTAGSSRILSVVVSGTGPFTYQWRKDGVAIAGATQATYSIPAQNVAGSASYDVVVAGPVSTSSSNLVRVDNCVPVSVAQHPVSVARALGQPAEFMVTAGGTGPFTYQWMKNGVAIAGATTATYAIDSVQATSAAGYSVKITGPVGSIISSAASLVIHVTPSIVTQPVALYKGAGQSATFAVTAAGTGPFTYQWSKDGNSIAGANAASLALPSVSAADVGRYSVSVSNAVGAVLSQEAELQLVTGPVISAQPVSQGYVPKVAQTYRVRYFGFTAGPEGWSVTTTAQGFTQNWGQPGWYWNAYLDEIPANPLAANLEGGFGGSVVSPWISLVGVTNPELHFVCMSSQTGASAVPGTLSIQASADGVNWTTLFTKTNDSAMAAHSASLAAYAGTGCYLRASTTSSCDAYLDEVEVWGYGLPVNSANLSVAASGGGLAYQWYKDGVPIAGATTATYAVADVYAPGAVGGYSVKVSNAAGSVNSTAAVVAIKPSISTQPVGLNKLNGQSASFSVVAAGTGPFTYQWHRNGSAIPGATGATHVIASASAQTSGSYHVVVTNAVGQVASQAATLSVTLPPTITAQPISYTVPVETETIAADTSFDFETGLQGWTASAGPGNQSAATWVHAVSTGAGSPLKGLYCDNNSSSSVVRYITSPRISLADITAPYVSYVSGYTAYTATRQGNLQVEASADGINWDYLYPVTAPDYGSPFTARAPGTTYSSLSQYAGGDVYLRFRATGPSTGFWLDDVVVAGYKYPSGKSVTFSVAATGEGNAYQWFKDGVALPGATASSYKVVDCRLAASLGSYTVKVANVAGSVTSAAAVLTTPLPVVTGQPQSYSGSWPSNYPEVVLRNGFDLGPEGWGPVGAGYPGWLWNDQRFEDGGNAAASSLEGNGYVRSPLISLAGVSNPSVTFDISAYQGVCTLEASLDGVAWSTLFTLDGFVPPGGKTKTVSLSAYAGRSIYLRFYSPATGAALVDNVVVSGFSRAHTMTASVAGVGCSYQWFRNGVAIAGATSASYRVADVALAASAGSYTVRVTNSAGSALSNAAVIPAFSAPVIVSQPASLSVAGATSTGYTLKNYTFNAGAEGWTYGSNGANMSYYNWGWDSQTGGITDRLLGSAYASNTDTYTQSPWISFLGASSPLLSFTAYHELYPDSLDVLEVQASADGLYWSTLRSIYGNGNGVYNVSLAGYQFAGGCYLRYRLRTSPLFNAWGVMIYDTVVTGSAVTPGQSAGFSVALASSAGCSFQWFKNNVAIPGATGATYYIPNAYSSDAGVYKVVVTNPAGSVTSSSATLTVR
jgi:hypothetical protein